MNPVDICREVVNAGLVLWAEGDDLVFKPAARLTPELRVLLLEHKPEMLEFLAEAHERSVRLIEAAMRACDAHGDGEEARLQMRRDCLDTPIHLRDGLREHFDREYPGSDQSLD